MSLTAALVKDLKSQALQFHKVYHPLKPVTIEIPCIRIVFLAPDELPLENQGKF